MGIETFQVGLYKHNENGTFVYADRLVRNVLSGVLLVIYRPEPDKEPNEYFALPFSYFNSYHTWVESKIKE